MSVSSLFAPGTCSFLLDNPKKAEEKCFIFRLFPTEVDGAGMSYPLRLHQIDHSHK